MGTKLRKSIGNNIELEHVATHTASVGVGTAVSVLFTAATSGICTTYFEAEIFSKDAWSGTLSETSANGASAGTAIISYCKDRTVTASANATIVHTITYASSGAVLENHESDGGIPVKTRRYILASGGMYLIYITSAGAANSIDVNLHFWED